MATISAVAHEVDIPACKSPSILPARVIPRLRRAPPPVEDDTDIVGYGLLVLLFLAAVWQ